MDTTILEIMFTGVHRCGKRTIALGEYEAASLHLSTKKKPLLLSSHAKFGLSLCVGAQGPRASWSDWRSQSGRQKYP